MPILTPSEEEHLRKLSNRIFDVLHMNIGLSEERANEISEEAMALIERKIKS